MAKIYVGNEYDKTFDSIVRMYNEGFVPETLIKSINKNSILTNSHEFILKKDADNSSDEHLTASINNEGASWFAFFRGAKSESKNAEWLMFVESVKDYFHKNYSLVEYCPRDYKLSPNEIALQKQIIEQFLKLFYKDYNFEIFQGEEKEGIEDIYGASVRMELSDGTGEAVPVLGKIFFRKTARGIVPYSKEQAENISKYLQVFDKQQKDFVSSQNSLELTDTVLNALDKLINASSGSDNDLSKYLVFASQKDDDAVGIMIEKGPNEKVDIICQSLSIMNISHLRWKNDNYNIRLNEKTVMKAIFGIGGKLSIFCNNCKKKTPLLEFNQIKYTFEGKKKLLNIFLDRENFGIPLNILEEIRTSNVFSKHLMRICCTENARLAGPCVRYVCEDDTLLLEDNIQKCKNCPYPEVLFLCEDGTTRYTKNLAFARDRMTLVPKDKTVKCGCCGRTFYSEQPVSDYLCDFCKIIKTGISSLDFNDYKEGNKLYSKYASALPLSIRLKNIKSRKYCKEDEDCILFVIDKTVFIFDKEKLSEKGFLPSPVKITSQGGGNE